MNKKENMKQAMYEMFGVGADQTAKENSVGKEERKSVSVPVIGPKAAAAVPASAAGKTGAVSYLAPGTVFEGVLRSDGDVEIAGQFKGDVTAEGTVVLRSPIQGNITARSLKLIDCTLKGDVAVKDMVTVSLGSAIDGNVTAKDVHCAGRITGDLKIAENTALEDTAQVSGSIVTGSISVVKGAVICGGIEIKQASASDQKAGGAAAAK